MKRLSLFLLPAVIGMLASGCARIEQLNPERPVEEEFLIDKTFYAETEDTRTTLDGVDIYFSEGESLSIWDGSGNREFKAREAGRNVSFSGKVSETATAFYALSPYSASTVFAQDGSTVTASLTLPSSQEATAGSFADGANISAAQSTSEDSFSLKNLLGVVKMTLASANLDGHEIQSIELTSTHPLAGDVVVTYGETPAIAAGANTVKTVKLAHADGSALADGTYYLTLLPNDGGQITIKFIATDGYTATKTATLKSAFEANSIKNLGSVKGLNWEAPKYYFMPVSEVTDGTYLIVAKDGEKWWAAKPVDPSTGNSYGYLAKEDVKSKVDNNGFIVMDHLDYGFQFAKVPQGYTIQQVFNGLYWYQDGSYNTISVAQTVSQYYSAEAQSDGTMKVINLTKNKFLQFSTEYKSFGSYSDSQEDRILPNLYRLVDPDTVEATVTLTTLEASDVTGATAVLNASYTDLFPFNAVDVGFYYGTSQTAMNEVAYDNSVFSSGSGSISVEISSLSENTTYYYRATMHVLDPVTGNYVEFVGEIKSFKTGENVPVTGLGWLELPEDVLGSDYYTGSFFADGERNYTYLYQYSTYTSLWTAYPLYSGTMGGGYSAKWKQNPNIDKSLQVNCWDGSYNVLYGETDYVNDASATGQEYYARGHQIPNADRNGIDLMQAQTFYATNSTPQIQKQFNDKIWKELETDVRTIASATDTLYVVTGAAFYQLGVNGNESITYIHPKKDPNKNVPVPNYYWKVLLKVKWTGSGSSKTVSDARAIGVWLPHGLYDNTDYSSYVHSVNDIETWTGLDLFKNLPGNKYSGLEKTAQENTSWSAFQNF